jgi:hypothetical protein
MKSKATRSAEKIMDEIHDIHTAAWASAAPPASRQDAFERIMADAMRKLSRELLLRGVTTAILEGAYLIWWLRLACINHGFAKGGFERSLDRIGPLTGPISHIMIRLGKEIEDAGPTPEMRRLGKKLEQLRYLHGGSVVTAPNTRQEEEAQTETAHALIQKTLIASADVGIPPSVLESMLLYFWFRCTANRYNLTEAFFQKIERNWGTVMDHINRYMDEQATADRQRV